MTRETRLILSLDEIQGVRWQCNKCGAATSYRLDQTIRLPQACPSCNEPFTEAASFDEFQRLEAFVAALKHALRVSTHPHRSLGGTLTLEVLDHPD
jgi:transcription initiation factor IIE alpha subunit